ncbi:MAG: amidophosphoribosyltransferase [Gammaproteobacteria bacterium]|nr:amidophosphoribosyltransferase [Gammaproteobacteria bacterium]
MCGIIGILSNGPVNQSLYDGLTVLQHRGQDAAGMMTGDGDVMYLRKSNGLVRDVFHTRHMLRLKGNMGIAHTRYPTAGCFSSAESQPFYVNSPFGIALAHNGNLTNAEQIKRELFATDKRHINTSSDSEVLLNVLAHELQLLVMNKLNVDPNDLFAAVSRVHQRCKGAYAVVAMIVGRGILAFRDPFGIRPLVIGKRITETGTDYMVASESVAIDVLGYQLVRDVDPGEAVYFDTNEKMYTQQCADHPMLSPCIFEHVYFARPDSMMDGISVHKARMRMGEHLARKIQRLYPQHDIDVVLPIPDTSRTSALQLSYTLGLKYSEGFIKNRYIGRTFIMPGQTQRKKSVRQKLNPINLEFKGKNVLLVDDSIVRGTTSQQIIQMARDAGARKVYFASAAPPVRFPNVYGIDMPVASELIGYGRDEEQIAKFIGADWLVYQELADLIEAVRKKAKKLITRFDASVFDGDYVTGDITPHYLQQLEIQRNDATRANDIQAGDAEVMELYNSA